MREHEPVLDDVLTALASQKARYAVAGAHAFGLYARPRATVDVDFLVDPRRLEGTARALEVKGYKVSREADVVRVYVASGSPQEVADLLRADAHPVWAAALVSVVEARLLDRKVKVVTRAALVAMKFFSATSPTRPREERIQDAADLAKLVLAPWSARDQAQAMRLAALAYPGAARDFEQLLDDLITGRPILL
jgi:hypothetical protein